MKPSNASLASWRVDLRCEDLGFPRPPAMVHARLKYNEGNWSLTARVGQATAGPVGRWLESFGPKTLRQEAGLSPRWVEAVFGELSRNWVRLFSAVVIERMEFYPDGSLTLFLRDFDASIRAFVDRLRIKNGHVRARPTLADARTPPLTAAQWQALKLAVANGYYEMPHAVRLRDLAQKLSRSVGATSDLLRRAEAAALMMMADSETADPFGGPLPESGNRLRGNLPQRQLQRRVDEEYALSPSGRLT